ncbi:methionyl-tRNA formyltransferase, partial [Dioszegia hungarica]
KPFDILFCGSDAFSTASLKAVLDAKDVWRSLTVLVPHEKPVRVKGSITSVPCALSEFARESDISVFQVPASGISAYELPEKHLHPSPTSLLITASFGHILPDTFLSHFLPTHRLNVHPSLLPRWRGAAPVQWTIASGDKETGVSVQRLVERGKGIDSGEIVGVRDGIPVPDDATYHSLLPSLAEVGGKVLVDVLRSMQKGEIQGPTQDPALITRAPKINEETARIRWTEQSSEVLLRLSRGISHQIPLWTIFAGQKIQLIEIASSGSSPAFASSAEVLAGTAVLDRKAQVLRVACAGAGADGTDVSWIAVTRVKPAGRRAMGVMEWWNGLPREVRAGKYITL